MGCGVVVATAGTGVAALGIVTPGLGVVRPGLGVVTPGSACCWGAADSGLELAWLAGATGWFAGAVSGPVGVMTPA